MALFFRLNVLSGKLGSFRFAITQSLPRSLIYQYRGIFTNINGIKFKRNNGHDLKNTHCPDVEEYFKKVKKGESDKKQPIKSDDARWGKKIGDNNKKSPASMFDHHNESTSDQKSTLTKSSLLVKFINKGSSNESATINYHKASPSQQHNLNDIKQDAKQITTPIQQEPCLIGANDKNVNRRNSNLWIALVGAGLCGISALFWFRNLENNLDVAGMNTDKVVAPDYTNTNTNTDVSKVVFSNGLNSTTGESKAVASTGTNAVTDVSKEDDKNAEESKVVSSSGLNSTTDVSKIVASTSTNAITNVYEKVAPDDKNTDVPKTSYSEGLNTTTDVSKVVASASTNAVTNVYEKVAPDDQNTEVPKTSYSEGLNTTTDVSKVVASTGENAITDISNKISTEKMNTTTDEPKKVASVGMNTTADVHKVSSNDDTTVSDDVNTSNQKVTSQTSPKENSYKVPYVIIGGGTSAVSAYRTIRKRVPNAKVLIITNEIYPPYMRPPLSKELWSADNSNVVQKIYFEANDFYVDPARLLEEENGGVAILNGSTAKRLNISDRKVILSKGTEIEYDECLLATGTKPQNLLIFRTAPIGIRSKISSLKNISDFQRLKEIVDESESIAIVGGGFVASEISFALAKYAGDKKKFKVYQIFHEDGNMGMSLPKYLSDWVKKRLINCGVFIIPNTQVDSVKLEKSKLKLELLNGKLVVVNHVIVALGSQVDARFAKLSELQVNGSNNGIIVNEYLEAKPHMYVAGDAACLPEMLGKETEKSHDHATASGQLAAENMTGLKKPFTHQSMFWSNMGQQISFESVGLIDAALKTVGVFSQNSEITMNEKDKFNLKDDEQAAVNHNKGVIFYLKKDKVVGIVLWNVFNKINIARQVIADGNNLSDISEVAKLFEIEQH